MPISSIPTWGALKNKPTTLSGFGITDASQLGIGQTPQDVTASRSAGVVYTNSSGKPIQVSISSISTSVNGNLDAEIAGVATATRGNQAHTAGAIATLTFMVPSGATYKVTAGACTISKWIETR